MRCSGHRPQRMIVLNSLCDGSDLSHVYFSCIQLNWRVDRMSFNSRFDYSIIHACGHSIFQWFYHLIIRLCYFWLSDHSIIWSLDHSIIGSSTIRSSDWLVGCSIIRSSKHSIMRSLDHSIIRSLDPLKADYSRLELTVANWLLQTQRLTLAEWLHLVFELFNEHLIQ